MKFSRERAWWQELGVVYDPTPVLERDAQEVADYNTILRIIAHYRQPPKSPPAPGRSIPR